MPDQKPTILVTNVTVENITVTPGVAVEAAIQVVTEQFGRITSLPKLRRFLK